MYELLRIAYTGDGRLSTEIVVSVIKTSMSESIVQRTVRGDCLHADGKLLVRTATQTNNRFLANVNVLRYVCYML